MANNQNIKIALARLDQARSQLEARQSTLFPSIQATPSYSDSRISANRPLGNYAVPNSSTTQNDFKPIISMNYEFDWLGKIRRDVESASAARNQSESDLANVRLLILSQLTTSYFQLRQGDEEVTNLENSKSISEKINNISNRAASGIEQAASGPSGIVNATTQSFGGNKRNKRRTRKNRKQHK